MGLLKSLCSPAQVKLSSVGNLGQLSSPLLGFEQVVVGGLDSVIRVAVLTLLKAVQTPELVNLLLVACPLLLELGKFKVGVVNFLLEAVALVRLLSDVPLGGENLSLAPIDLLSSGRNFSLQVVVVAVLLVEQEASVIDIFVEHVK